MLTPAAPAEDVPYPTNEFGVVTGNGCLQCIHMGVKLYPKMSWDELMELTSREPAVKHRLEGALEVWQSIQAQVPPGIKVFEPASQVGSEFVIGTLAVKIFLPKCSQRN